MIELIQKAIKMYSVGMKIQRPISMGFNNIATISRVNPKWVGKSILIDTKEEGCFTIYHLDHPNEWAIITNSKIINSTFLIY